MCLCDHKFSHINAKAHEERLKVVSTKLTCTPLDWTLHHLCIDRISPLLSTNNRERQRLTLRSWSPSSCGSNTLLSSSSQYLKELHSDTSEHELEQRGDDHDVANGPDGHKHALDHMLQRPSFSISSDTRCCTHCNMSCQWNSDLKSFGSVDRPEWTKDPQNTKNLHH